MPKIFSSSEIRKLVNYFPSFPATINRFRDARINTILTDQGFRSKGDFRRFWLNQLQDEVNAERRLKAQEQRQRRNEKARERQREKRKLKKYQAQVAESKARARVAKEVRNRNQALRRRQNEEDFIYPCFSEREAYANFYRGYEASKYTDVSHNVVILEYDPFDTTQDSKLDVHFVGNTRTTTKKEMKQNIHFILYAIFQKNEDDVTSFTQGVVSPINVRLCFIADVKPMEYIHSLRDSEVFNCFLTQMKAWAITNDDKKTYERVNALNTRYFQTGVKFTDIPDICSRVHCNVEIYNKLDDKLFEYKYSTGKYKTFKYVITKLDHVETYIEDMFNVSAKKIEYVPDVQQAFNDCGDAWKCYTKTKDGKLVYFFTHDKVYKHAPTEAFDEGLYFINDQFDLENMRFNKEYELERNVMIKDRDEALFEFVNKANHYVFEIYLTENVDQSNITTKQGEWDDLEGKYIEDEEEETTIDLSSYYAYDQNKNYMSYKTNEYYKQYKFPKTGNFEFYDVGECNMTLCNKILTKTGFAQIGNVDFTQCNENTKKIMQRLQYFKNGGIYTTPSLKFLADNGATFTITRVAFTNWTYTIDFSDEILTNKFYNKIVGMMDMKSDHRIIKTVYSDVTELKDLLYASADKITFYSGNELWFKLPKACVKNNCHISAFILSYAFLAILEPLLKVNYEDIIGVKVDCIITKKNYDHVFKLSKEVGDFKREKKGDKTLFDCGFINDIEPFEKVAGYKLTDYKLDYKKLNFITGEAGAGKTTRYVATFGETDERVYNALMCFPNNNLKNEFNKKYDRATSTYHKAFMIGSGGEDNDGIKLKYYANAILDEASMISYEHFKQIVKFAYKYCVNLHVVGDYDIVEKKLFQLTPPEGKPFVEWINARHYLRCDGSTIQTIEDGYDNHLIEGGAENGIYKLLDEDYVYGVHLSENYRQGDDKVFTEFLRSCRGQTNKQIIEKLKTYTGVNKIQVNDISKHYKEGDVVLCSVNDYVNKINNILKTQDKIQIKYKKTTRTHAKNEMAIVAKDEYDEKTMDLAFSITNHLCQGLEYKNNIFIVMDRLFEDNMLYVCLSRAHKADQVYIVYVPQGSKILNAECNVTKKLNKYKHEDKAKGLTFDLDKQYVLDMIKAQEGKCKHCGIEVQTENYMPFSMKQFSVDRIDDSKGHCKGNVVISCFGCNCKHKKTEQVTKEEVQRLVNKLSPNRSEKFVGYALFNIGHENNLDLEDVYTSFGGCCWETLSYYPGGLNIGSLVMWVKEDTQSDSA